MKKKQRNEVFLGGDPFPELSELYAGFDEEWKRIREQEDTLLRELDEAYQKEFGPALDALRTWAKKELEPAEKEMRKELDHLQTPD